MIKQHFGAICISIAIILAAIIYAFATRYQPVVVPNTQQPALDRWTGGLR